MSRERIDIMTIPIFPLRVHFQQHLLLCAAARCSLHREGSSSQFASVRVQKSQLQTAQRGQTNFILDANYLHQLLLLNAKKRERKYE